MTPDPNAAPFTLAYAAAQIGWVALFVLLLWMGARGWQRLEQRRNRRRPTVVFLPHRDATVVRIYPRDEAS